MRPVANGRRNGLFRVAWPRYKVPRTGCRITCWTRDNAAVVPSRSRRLPDRLMAKQTHKYARQAGVAATDEQFMLGVSRGIHVVSRTLPNALIIFDIPVSRPSSRFDFHCFVIVNIEDQMKRNHVQCLDYV